MFNISQVILGSKSLVVPYIPNEKYQILNQRGPDIT